MKNSIVYEDQYFQLVSPQCPYNSREDGGHLILNKKEEVTDRSEMTYQEAIDFMRISMVVGRAMYDVLNIERMNYEDLGNWGLDTPGGAKMHLHFYGRAKVQIHQTRGEHLSLFHKGHPIYSGHLHPFSDKELQRLEERILQLEKEEKYQKMAELAGISIENT